MEDYENIDEYIAKFSGEPRKRLEIIRKLLADRVPSEATEKISYGIPTIFLNGNLIHFAAYANHIGLYPGAALITQLKKELAAYKTSKGTVQFPHDKPLPLELITTIINLCIERNMSKSS